MEKPHTSDAKASGAQLTFWAGRCLRAFLSSLRDFLFIWLSVPGLKAWAIFGSPCGTAQKEMRPNSGPESFQGLQTSKSKLLNRCPSFWGLRIEVFMKFGVSSLRFRIFARPKSLGEVSLALALLVPAVGLTSCARRGAAPAKALLISPGASGMNRRAPELFRVRLETSKGTVVLEIHRDWSPHGADRFFNLVEAGFYDEARFFRVIKGRWAQFGVNGDPRTARVWREQTIPDDPRRESNLRGTIAYAFAVPNGRTTQVFINLRDNSATHDGEGFVPFGRVIEGMEVVDALNGEYGESAGGGIRGGKQDSMFEGGNEYLGRVFPRLDCINRAVVDSPKD
jgi:peptidyl-prolyl cis-trans isomerase A (cyclophilin A)